MLKPDPSGWIWNVPRFRGVAFDQIYRGIGLVYYSRAGSVEFDFHLAPQASVEQIRLAFRAPVQITPAGELTAGATKLRTPHAWQSLNGQRRSVPVRYVRLGTNRAGLRLGDYDVSLPLTIDPIIEFATFLGGSETESDTRIAVAADGSIYVAGTTNSADFPASLPEGSLLNRPEMLVWPDVYVSRMRADATTLDWSIFLGGSYAEKAGGLRLDKLGNVYVMGTTESPNFPVTSGSFRNRIHATLSDLFLVKLDATTGHIKASTFLNVPIRPDSSGVAKLAVDAAGGAYVAGTLNSGDFQTTPGVVQPTSSRALSGNPDNFAIRLDASLSAVVYATYLGFGSVAALEADEAGNVVFGGIARGCLQCGTPDFPAVNPIPEVNQKPFWPAQAYVAKLNAAASAIIFATLLHGDDRNSALSDLKLTGDGNIQLLGYNQGSKFPLVNPVPFGVSSGEVSSDPAPFLARLAASGDRLLQSTLFNGREFSNAPSLAFPANMRLALLPDGSTCMVNIHSRNLQQTPGGLIGATTDSSYVQIGGSVTCIDPSGSRFSTKTFLPAGAAFDEVAPTSDGALLLTGTAFQWFATTPNTVQPEFAGGRPGDPSFPFPAQATDAFLLRLSLANPAPTITGLNPGSTLIETNVSGMPSLDVYGYGFAYGAAATWNGQEVESNFVDSSRLVLPKIDYSAIHAGPNRLHVTMPGPGGGASEAYFNAINATPSAVSISPGSVVQGAPETKLVIRAANLMPDSELYWNGQPRGAQYVVDSLALRTGHFELMLAATELVEAKVARIAVSNRPPGGGLSPEAFFTITAPGSAALTLAEPAPFLFGSLQLGPKIQLAGTGFTADTRIWWDGAAIPSEFVSATRIAIEPPAADLVRWGAHEVHAVDGSLRSARARVLIGRSIFGPLSAHDPSNHRLWLLHPRYENTLTYDLLMLDSQTGSLVASVLGVATSPQALTSSVDGSFRFIAEKGSPGLIRRFKTQPGPANTADMEWPFNVPENSGTASVALIPVPGAPGTVIAWNSVDGLFVYDDDRPRPRSAVAAGFLASDVPEFVAGSRIYLRSQGGSCWRWMEFDATGVTGGSPGCSSTTPEVVVRDGELTYLTDGQRNFAVSVPASATLGAITQVVADLPRRRAYALGWASGILRLMEFNLDTHQQRILVPGLYSPYPASMHALYLDTEGGLLLINGALITLLP